MFTHVVLILLNAAHCLCSAEFQMFPGFDPAATVLDDHIDDTEPPWLQLQSNEDFVDEDTETSTSTTTTTVTTAQRTKTTTEELPSFDCLEDEKPSNIGPYEVPSEKDLVLLVKKSLVNGFQRYNRKTLILLGHIKEATKSAKLQAKHCQGQQRDYRTCLKEVNRQATSVTKNLMTMVEEHKQSITFFTKGKICNMNAMTPNPLIIVKKLAVEEASLKFALPAFLRLLNECHNNHCRDNFSKSTAQKPRRRLSDSAFLVKHFLTKNDGDLIKDLK